MSGDHNMNQTDQCDHAWNYQGSKRQQAWQCSKCKAWRFDAPSTEKTAWERSIETFSDEQLLFELVRRNGFQRAPAKTEWYGDDWILSTVGVGANHSVSITMNQDDFKELAALAVVGWGVHE